MPGRPKIFLVAGEPSGDALGARLMAGLKDELAGEVEFAGVGGPMMKQEGLNSTFPMSDLSVMGIAEVLPRLPLILSRMKETVAAIKKENPTVVITIDAPDFSFRVGKKLKAEGAAIPLVHYVAPTVWAWRPGRARKIAAFLDHLLLLLPFEPPYFKRVGLDCSFVGHSVLESGANQGDGEGFRRKHGVNPDDPLLCVLPGSRRGELSRLLPVFHDTVSLLDKKIDNLEVVIPTLSHLVGDIRQATENWPVPVRIVEGEQDKFAAFAAANVALAASGTVALELAMAQTPNVIAYKMNPITAMIGKMLVKVKYANLVNIILDREVVPECLLGDCRADILSGEIERLLLDDDKRQKQIAGMTEAMKALGAGDIPPSRRAARAVIHLIEEKAKI